MRLETDQRMVCRWHRLRCIQLIKDASYPAEAMMGDNGQLRNPIDLQNGTMPASGKSEYGGFKHSFNKFVFAQIQTI